jgi:hypothetical protein
MRFISPALPPFATAGRMTTRRMGSGAPKMCAGHGVPCPYGETANY